MAIISMDMTIAQILEAFPETREVFTGNGFSQFADDEVLRELGPVLRLKTALRSRGLNPEVFFGLLEAKIQENDNCRRLSPAAKTGGNPLNLLALLPCPLKVPLQEELKAVLESIRRQDGVELNYSIDTSANKYISYEDYVPYFEDPEEIPDIILTTGFEFLHDGFVSKFIHTGLFLPAGKQAVNRRMAETGLADPKGEFFVLAVNALVMVVDTGRLQGLPRPRRWADLLDEIYEQQVVMRGHGDIYCDALQLNYFKEYGWDGIRRLARSVRYGLHPAQMVKELTGGRTDVPPIYVMPRFFAETLQGRKNIEIIWPEDGALTYPLSLLVKAEKAPALHRIVDYLTGSEAARMFDDAFFPALHPAAGGNLPAEARFKWLGWDFIRSCGIEALQQDLNEGFLAARKGK